MDRVLYSFALVTILALSSSVTALDDKECSPWDDLIPDLLFDPLRDDIKNASMEFYKFPDYSVNLPYNIKLQTIKGEIGNLSTFNLIPQPNGKPSSYMCQKGSNMTLAMIVGLDNLEVKFEDVLARLPVFPNAGNTPTTIRIIGNSVSFSVSLLGDDPNTCQVSLNYLQIQDLSHLSLEFEHGVMNKIYQFIFNRIQNIVVNHLKAAGVFNRLADTLEKTVAKIVSKNGKTLCSILLGG